MDFARRTLGWVVGAIRGWLARWFTPPSRGRPRPRIVVDTNVLMGGLIAPRKASGRVLRAWLDGRVEPVVSPEVQQEYRTIFNRMRFGPRRDVERREEMLRRLLASDRVREVLPARRVDVVKACPSDNRLIECAVEGQARYIVSQDHHLLEVGEFEGVRMVTARDFLRIEFPDPPPDP